jgi:hypothetical protein
MSSTWWTRINRRMATVSRVSSSSLLQTIDENYTTNWFVVRETLDTTLLQVASRYPRLIVHEEVGPW